MDQGVFGVIAPHPPIMVEAVGHARAAVTAASIEGLGRIARALESFDPETIVLMSPHAPALTDAFSVDDSDVLAGSLADFGDPAPYRYRGDPELASAICGAMGSVGVASVPRSGDPRLRPGILDHASVVPLSFLDPAGARQLVVLGLSYLPYAAHRAAGAAIRSAADSLGRRIAFVASGDLSHRLTTDAPAGYSPLGAQLDKTIVDLVRQGTLEALMDIDSDVVEAGGECGLRSFVTLGGFCGDDPVPTKVLSYEGPWGVGYLTAVAGGEAVGMIDTTTPASGRKGGTPGQAESPIVALARAAIESYVREGRALASPHLDGSDLPSRAGAFVSLHRDGMLRGCIGTVLATRDTLAEEVAANAVEAAVHDPRFPALSVAELADLEIKVDVLHEPESCTLGELDPAQYGVITSSGWRRGLLLPDLEGVDDVETQVGIAMQKAGIREGEPCSFERFKVDRYT